MADEQTEELLKVDCAKGKVRDFELYKRSKLCLHPNTEALVDLGYIGILKLHSLTPLRWFCKTCVFYLPEVWKYLQTSFIGQIS